MVELRHHFLREMVWYLTLVNKWHMISFGRCCNVLRFQGVNLGETQEPGDDFIEFAPPIHGTTRTITREQFIIWETVTPLFLELLANIQGKTEKVAFMCRTQQTQNNLKFHYIRLQFS